jgi:hypothetical protein
MCEIPPSLRRTRRTTIPRDLVVALGCLAKGAVLGQVASVGTTPPRTQSVILSSEKRRDMAVTPRRTSGWFSFESQDAAAGCCSASQQLHLLVRLGSRP